MCHPTHFLLYNDMFCSTKHVFCSAMTCSVPPNMFSGLQFDTFSFYWPILSAGRWVWDWSDWPLGSWPTSNRIWHSSCTSTKCQQNYNKQKEISTPFDSTHDTIKAYWRPGCTNNLCNDFFIFIIIFLFSMLRNMEQLKSASKTKTDAGVTFQFSCRHMYLAETTLFLFITLVDISCLFWANVLSCVLIGCNHILCYIFMASNHVPSMHFMSIKLCNQIL